MFIFKLLLSVVTAAVLLCNSEAQSFAKCVEMIKIPVHRCLSLGMKYGRCDKVELDPAECNACPGCSRVKDLCLIRELDKPELAGCAQARTMKCSLKRKYGRSC
ncbi:hypothetical protein D915_007538 [Fasciola hepatica]|uniref:Uncharacterized protein n=1 Tax=Fasciola hepatica TaxID=6192 RepID=A0A4E0R4U0_FASHE|nr:hypothetical protein D915_007538 [Fasciola hepatica]